VYSRWTGIIKCIGIDISFLCKGDPTTVYLSTKPGDGPQVIPALYADPGGIPGEMLTFLPLIRMDVRGDSVDDQVEDTQPAEKAGKPVALPNAFYNVLAIAAGELHDRPVTQGIVKRERGPYLHEEPVMHGYAGIVQKDKRRSPAGICIRQFLPVKGQTIVKRRSREMSYKGCAIDTCLSSRRAGDRTG